MHENIKPSKINYTKIGLIGDVHCENTLLKKAIDFLISENIDKLFCTGDITDGIGDFDKCVKLLSTHAVNTVLGNHDEWFLENTMRSLGNSTKKDDVEESSIVFLKKLPQTRTFNLSFGKVLVCHGLGENTMSKLTPDDYGYAIEANENLQKILTEKRYKVVLAGHTHKRMIRRINECIFINAGTLMRSKDSCFSIVDFIQKQIEFFLFDKSDRISNSEVIQFPLY